ncbi:unnamed protein product [Somion occarium]|uniref:Uncharacterized protein n=1 Tax=Somion occarium TaxID=3059160 RepID=A0ABP1DC19_9APHY
MLRNASKNLKVRPSSSPGARRCLSQGSARSTRGSSKNYVAAASSAALTATALWYFMKLQPVHNDAPKAEPTSEKKSDSSTGSVKVTNVDDESLTTLVWGSNKSHVLLPSADTPESLKTPTSAGWLQDVALRDLALHERHAACVDAKGDVYQWGDGFFGESSTTGRIYVLASEASKQELPIGGQTPASTPWWGTGWLWDEEQNIDFAEMKPNEKLGRHEKLVSIAAGNDHLLGLTSAGRTFAHPINLKANDYGQLGFRKFDVPDHAPHHIGIHPPGHIRIPVELTPKSIADPYAKSTPTIRSSSVDSRPEVELDDSSIRFSDKLFEIPALKGIWVDQIAAGGRSSYAKTADGRVLGWGANEYGQIGLGRNVALDTITVPTEIILWRATPQTMRTTCLDITAGGDLAFFKVERNDGTTLPYIDVLSCGNGQWGGLGNALYSNAQGTPLRAKAISGLVEYCETSNDLQPIQPHAISISPTGHVLLTLDTLARSGPGAGGRDLLVWGANSEYQLGNGKRGSVASPRNLEGPDGERFMLGKKKAKEVKDLLGNVWKRGVEVEQCALAGPGNSVVYWKIC